MPRVVEYFRQSLKAALNGTINMVTFANLGSVRLPSLKFVGLRVRKIMAYLVHVSCLSTTTVSQSFEPQLQKVVILCTPGFIFIFCLPWGRPCGNHAKRCTNENTIQCLPNPSQHVPIYLQQFPSYTMLKSMRKSKNRYFYHILISPGDAPGAITLNVVWMEREFNAYKLSRCMCPSNYNRL